MHRFLFFLLFATTLTAQTSTPAPTAPAPSGTNTAKPLFRCTLPGGTYEVALAAIVAVTSHEYLVDGVARVTEVNIDTTGTLLARFYYLEPNTPNTPSGIGAATIDQAQKILTDVSDKTGQDAWKKVLKNYPTTTHARTVEYRLQSREQLNQVYEQAEQAFRLHKHTLMKVE